MTKSLSAAAAVYRRILEEYGAPRLAFHGFRPSGAGFFAKWVGSDCYWQVACLFDKVRGRDEGWLTVTLCVGFRPLRDFLEGSPVRLPTQKRPCMMAANLGTIRAPFKYQRWRLLPDTDVAETGGEVVRELGQHGVRFFEEYGSLETALAAWESGVAFNLGGNRVFYIAAAYCLAGQQDRARQLVDQTLTEARRVEVETGRPSATIWRQEVENFAGWLDKKTSHQAKKGQVP